VPLIAVKLGRDPYGFIGKFQALRADWDSAAEGIVKLLIKQDRMLGAYIQALRKCKNFDRGNMLARILPEIERASDEQIDELVAAYNENKEAHLSFGFRGDRRYGPGLISHLHRLGRRRFTQDSDTAIITPAITAKQPLAARRTRQ
jgi:hypothetical protein